MEVILLEKMRNLGALGEKVKVKSGFARNFLIPQGKAVYATKANLEKFNQRRAELEKIAEEKLQKALAKQKQLNDMPAITMTAKASEEGKLFGSITNRDITDALIKAGADIEKRQVRLNEGSLRAIGQYEVFIELESDITATVKIIVAPEATN